MNTLPPGSQIYNVTLEDVGKYSCHSIGNGDNSRDVIVNIFERDSEELDSVYGDSNFFQVDNFESLEEYFPNKSGQTAASCYVLYLLVLSAIFRKY